MNKKVIIIVVIIGLLFIGTGILIKIGNGTTNEKNNTNTNVTSKNTSYKNESNYGIKIEQTDDIASDRIKNKTVEFDSVKKIKTYADFYNSEFMVNKYISSLSDNREDVLLNLLDKTYINNKGLNTNNIIEILNPDYTKYSFVLKEGYEVSNNNNIYYFLNGYSREVKNADTEIEYKNMMFEVKYDLKSEAFTIIPLDNNTELYKFAKNFKPSTFTISQNQNNKYFYENFNISYIVSRYNQYFGYLLESNNPKSYDLLSDSMKKEFTSFEQLTYMSDDKWIKTFNMISDSILVVRTIPNEDSSVIYEVTTKNGYYYKIYNYGLLNFKIELVY